MTIYHIWSYLFHELLLLSFNHKKTLRFETVSDRVFSLKISLTSTKINSTGTDVFNLDVTSSVKVGAEFVPDIQHFYFSTRREVNDSTVLSNFKWINVHSSLELSPDEYFMVNGGYQLFDIDVDDDALAR